MVPPQFRASTESGTVVYVEFYISKLNSDIDQIENALEQPMPDAIRSGLEGELRKLQAMQEILLGEERSLLHSLRGKLRWTRKRLHDEKDPTKRKELERQIKDVQGEIARQAAREEV